MRELFVDRGTVEVSDDPETVLGTGPLGSGVALIAYHAEKKVGGLLHALLPREMGRSKVAATWPGLFVLSGAALLLSRMKGLGIDKEGLTFRAVGAAEVLGMPEGFLLGHHNVTAVRLASWLEGIPLEKMQYGGHHSQRARLYIANGEVAVLTVTGESTL